MRALAVGGGIAALLIHISTASACVLEISAGAQDIDGLPVASISRVQTHETVADCNKSVSIQVDVLRSQRTESYPFASVTFECHRPSGCYTSPGDEQPRLRVIPMTMEGLPQ
jgi:hypothetical protein